MSRLWSSAVRVQDSQAYRKMNVTWERISRILELREILLSFQTGFNHVNAAVVCTILESISSLEPSSVITEPRYLKLVTVSSFCPCTLILVSVRHKIATWELAVMIFLSIAMSKVSGFTLTLPCPWQSILTTLVVQRVLRSEELALFTSPDEESHCSADVLLRSQSFGLLQLFTH